MEIQQSRARARVGPGGEPVLLARPGPRALGPAADRARARRAGARRPSSARSGRTACRPRSPPATRGRGARRRPTGRRSRALYGALADARAVAGRRAQPRGRDRDGGRARRPAWRRSTRSRSSRRCAATTCCRRVRGDLLERLGRDAEARAEFARAASLTRNARERELLVRPAHAPTDAFVTLLRSMVQPAADRHHDLRGPAARDHTDPLPESEPPQPELALGMPYVRALARSGAIPVVLPPLALELVPGLLAPARRRLPVRRAGHRPRRLRRRAARRARARSSRTSTRSSSRSRARPTPPACRSSASAAAPRRSTSRAAGACSSTCPTRTARSAPQTAAGPSRTTSRSSPARGSRAPSAPRRCASTRSTTRPSSGSATACAPVAWAPDGTVEGIEGDDERLVLGVQWHAETLDEVERPQARLFGALVDAARERARRAGLSRVRLRRRAAA